MRDELREALQLADAQSDALEAVKQVLDGYVREVEGLKARLAQNPGEVEAQVDQLVGKLRANRELAAALALHGTAADANSGEDVQPQPITVPSGLPGQPGTTYPGGEELAGYPSPDSSPDMSSPKPSPGIEPEYPEGDPQKPE